MLLVGCGLCVGRDFSRPFFDMVEALPYGLTEMSGGVGVGLGGAFLGRGPAGTGCGFLGVQ